MNRTIDIRGYNPADHEAVTGLWKTVFPDDPPWNEPATMLAAKLDFQPEGVLIGVANGAVIAAVLAGYDGHRGWINALAVDPNHRGHGYGAAMIEAASARLKTMGAVKVNLQIRGGNNSLEAYYESLGFEVENRISMGMLLN